ncbi:hypothetical protein VT1337_09847, partial [Vibrio tubiashii NCIMB 1337 = ATCC 19106]
AGSSPAGGAILEKASSQDEAFSFLLLLVCSKPMSQPKRRTVLAGRVEFRQREPYLKVPHRKMKLFVVSPPSPTPLSVIPQAHWKKPSSLPIFIP